MRLVFLGILLVPLALARAEEPAGGESLPAVGPTISVLSYNVHGLFPLIAKDTPRDRMPTIGWLARSYDVVLFQEDFEYHDILRLQLEHHTGFVGTGMGWDPRRIVARTLLLPMSLALAHFSPPYGAGLSTFVRSEIVRADDVGRQAYGSCRGWLGGNGDCWTRKGFLRVGLATMGGPVDIYNTHLQSGPKRTSAEVRGRQLEELAEAIETRSAGRAVIVAGDFNISFNRRRDPEIMRRFRRRLELADSAAGPMLASWRERDYILYRGGPGMTLSVETSGEAMEFVSDRRALSDHAAIYARFRVTPVPGEEP